MTDSMNFGPEWLRNLSSEGSTTGISGGGTRYQLADYRYGREEMLALFEKSFPPPSSLATFPPLYSEQVLPPLALVPATDEERQWAARGPPLGPSVRGGRGAQGVGERGGRIARGGRGAYQPYGRTMGGGGGYEGGNGGWGGPGEQGTEWSPRKDFTYNRSTSSGGIDNWRRSNRTASEEEDGWRSSSSHGRGGAPGEKWSRSSSWREGDEEPREKRWHEPSAGGTTRGIGNHRRGWDSQEEHLPEWATENLAEGGGTFDSSGAFHGSDEESERDKGSKELQKSASQQNIRNQHAPLVTSKSAVSLSINKTTTSKGDLKDEKKVSEQEDVRNKANKMKSEKEMRKEHQEHHKPPIQEEVQGEPAKVLKSPPTLHTAKTNQSNNPNPLMTEPSGRVVEEDFEKLQEDFVSKLVVDEEPHKPVNPATNVGHSNVVVGLSNGGLPPPPPNIMPPAPLQEKWYYQDPQGDLQGPFLSTEMAEWFKAGYFSTTLFVRRQCDERFYTLGELVNLCNGNPFLSTVPIAPPKQDKLNDPELALHYQQQFLQAQMLRNRGFGQEPTPPWNSMQRDMYTPQPMMPPMGPEMISPAAPGNPLLHHMLTQFKLPTPQQPVMEEQPNPMQLDPLRALVQQMGGLQSLQPRMQANIPPPSALKHESTLPNMPPMHLPVNGTVPVLPPKELNPSSSKIDNDFMQFMQQHAAMNKPTQQAQMEQRIDLESLWKRNQNQFQQQQQQQQQQQPQQQLHQPVTSSSGLQGTPQWAQSDKPINMWDANTVQTVQGLQQVLTGNLASSGLQTVNQVPDPSVNNDVIDKKNKKEEKKLKEIEEKMAKKEAEEKRKLEQRKLELEKKQQEEKRKKEEERIRKELEKAKKEAEEKRLKELAEKKRLKEQRKEEEAKKKAAEELKKLDDEKERLAAKEREEQRKQTEMQRQLAQTIANQKPAKAAPWSQATNNQGMTLGEIQKLERERKAEQVLIQQQQQRQLQQAMLEQPSPEKVNNAFGVQLNWANKPLRPNHVKSLAEIQAEEQDRMLKQKEKEKAAQKEKEILSPPTSTIWSGQSLTWNNSDNAGFWDEQPVQLPQQQQKKQQQQQQLQQQKQNVNKQQQQQQAKKQTAKQQKEHHANNNANSNSSSEINSSDEFTNWCTRTLANMNTQVDIPTFVSFLRDIESALDVRDYIREYLGDKPATQQFAAQFLDKRRSFKPKQQVHKDDMCSPAPAITPSSQHNNDFQEVKGKGKKCKKSKMLKVDARILGFNVTAAQDRINVGDRDYGES